MVLLGFTEEAPDGWLPMLEATLAYGVSRQTIMQRVKDGRLRAVRVRIGRRKGLRIAPQPPSMGCSDHDNEQEEQCDDGSKHASIPASSTHRISPRPYAPRAGPELATARSILMRAHGSLICPACSVTLCRRLPVSCLLSW